MSEVLIQLGVGGTFALLVIREVLTFLKNRRPGSAEPLGGAGSGRPDTGAFSASHLKMLEELHTWHNMRDGDGVPVWYVKQDLRRTSEQLQLIIKSLKDIDEELDSVQQTQSKVVHRAETIIELEGRIAELQERRVTEAGANVRTSMTHVAETTQAVTEMTQLLRELKNLMS